MIRVVLVEDDLDLLDDIAFSLRDEGLQVGTCSSGGELDALLALETFEVAVLDIGLPGEDGLSIARRLRRALPGLGIVMLTARTSARDRVLGMEEGADAYLGKPVDLRELALVIRALARRLTVAEPANEPGLTLLCKEGILLTPGGQRIELTPSELQVIAKLTRATGRQATRRQLIESFGAAYLDYDERRLEAIVSRLRKKLEGAGLSPDTLRAIRGSGYVLQVPIRERQAAG